MTKDEHSDSEQVFEVTMKILLSIIAVYCIIGGYQYVSYKMKLEPNNEIEELIEDLAEEHLDIKIDLTASSPE